jgi:F-type H+-transporting ATPase subunit a
MFKGMMDNFRQSFAFLKDRRKRRIVEAVALVLALITASYVVFPPGALPVIQLSSEVVLDGPGPLDLTNTFIATLLVDIIILTIGFYVGRQVKFGEVPHGAWLIADWLFEKLLGLVQRIGGGKRAREIFPWFASVFLFLLIANWLELFPGVDSVGLVEPVREGAQGYEIYRGFLGITYLRGECPALTAGQYEALNAEEKIARGEIGCRTPAPADNAEVEHPRGYELTAFVRAATTDLNLTLGLGVVAMALVQMFGLRALGAAYLSKYFDFSGFRQEGGLIKRLFNGIIRLFISLLELISDISKVLSFAFRLFGNVFAGQVLLFVMSFLVPVVVPSIFYGLELFVGAIQAFVFATLMLVFISLAMISHHPGEHEES